jgi:hypothetical protein
VDGAAGDVCSSCVTGYWMRHYGCSMCSWGGGVAALGIGVAILAAASIHMSTFVAMRTTVPRFFFIAAWQLQASMWLTDGADDWDAVPRTALAMLQSVFFDCSYVLDCFIGSPFSSLSKIEGNMRIWARVLVVSSMILVMRVGQHLCEKIGRLQALGVPYCQACIFLLTGSLIRALAFMFSCSNDNSAILAARGGACAAYVWAVSNTVAGIYLVMLLAIGILVFVRNVTSHRGSLFDSAVIVGGTGQSGVVFFLRTWFAMSILAGSEIGATVMSLCLLICAAALAWWRGWFIGAHPVIRIASCVVLLQATLAAGGAIFGNTTAGACGSAFSIACVGCVGAFGVVTHVRSKRAGLELRPLPAASPAMEPLLGVAAGGVDTDLAR